MTQSTTVCDIFGCPENLTSGRDIISSGVSLVEIGVGLIFPALIILGIFVIVRAAVKMIYSEGDKEKIQDSVKMIKGVFIGIIILFIGIVGLILFMSFFQVSPSEVQVERPEILRDIDLPFI